MRRCICILFAAVSLAVSSSSLALAADPVRGEHAGAPTINCSTPLTLHDGTGQTGETVYVYARGLWVNLSTLAFDNKTSSFTVGACAIELAPQINGSGNHYTRCLFAGCVENSMLPGWNNVVSSVYLH